MEFKTKFNIGDKIFIIQSTTYVGKNICTACNGTKYINLGGDSFMCPKCSGIGYIENYDKEQWRVTTDSECAKRPIGKVEIESDGKYTDITYFPKNMGSFFHEIDCFKTEQEAQEECDRRNGVCNES